MSRTLRGATPACLVGALVIAVACRDKSPTGVDEGTVSVPETANVTPITRVDAQTFTCEDVEEVRVRFSSPGFVNQNDVALYAAFLGTPPGDKFLRIWWDYEGDREEFEIVDTQAGAPRRDDDDIFDVEAVVEHSYENLRRPMTFTVRVELILEGGTRGCARNRDVTVSPGFAGRVCQPFNLSGFSCPSGATEFCTSGSISATTRDQARDACMQCYGAPCFIETGDCAGAAFGPNPTGAPVTGDAYFGFQSGCSGPAGRIWPFGSSFTTFGRWAP